MGKSRKNKGGRLLLILIVAVIVAMIATNPKDLTKHNRAVQQCVETRIYPLTMEMLKEEIRGENGGSAARSVVSALVSGLLESDIVSNVTVNGIAEQLYVDRLENYWLFSVGYCDDDKMTVGLFGKTWMFADFMSDDTLKEHISDYIKDLL